MSQIELTEQVAAPSTPSDDNGKKTVRIYAKDDPGNPGTTIIGTKDSEGNEGEFVGPSGPPGPPGPEGPDGPIGPGDADTVSMNEVASGGAVNNVQSVHTRINSTGIFNGGGIITDNLDGTIAVSAGKGLIRANDDITSDLLSADFPEVASLALVDNDNNFIYAQYNGGNPNIVATTIKRADTNTNILLSTIFRSGVDLHIFNPSKHVIGDAVNSVLVRFKETRPFERASGALISATGTRNFAVTSGKFWEGLTPFNTNGIDLSVSGSFVYIHKDGVGDFTETPAQTQINNTQYDDGSGILATLSNNLYGVHWVFLESDGDYLVMYGQGNFSLSQAETDTIPAALPKRLQTTGRLVGKIVIKKDASVFISAESAFVKAFEISAPTDHNELINVQGDNATERFHLTAAEFNSIRGDGVSSAMAADDIDMSGDGIKTKTITGNTIFTISNPKLDRAIAVRLTGNFTIELPATVKNKTLAESAYNGTKICNMLVYCINATTPEYWATLLVGD